MNSLQGQKLIIACIEYRISSIKYWNWQMYRLLLVSIQEKDKSGGGKVCVEIDTTIASLFDNLWGWSDRLYLRGALWLQPHIDVRAHLIKTPPKMTNSNNWTIKHLSNRLYTSLQECVIKHFSINFNFDFNFDLWVYFDFEWLRAPSTSPEVITVDMRRNKKMRIDVWFW